MDIKQVIKWCWKNRLWFIVSLVLCIGVGVLFYCTRAPKRMVSAAIMLRTADKNSQQGQIMDIMGGTEKKQAADEITILTSRDLMGQVVDSLRLNFVVERKQGLRWIPVYPTPQFAFEYTPTDKKRIYKKQEDGDKYRIIVYPYFGMVDRVLSQISVTRQSRESQVITLSTESSNPKQAEVMINLLLKLYNEVSVRDKNAIAEQTQVFLDERIAVVQQELTQAETAMEVYKSTHRITDIEKTASEYQQFIEDYEHELAVVNLNLRVLDDLEAQLKNIQPEANLHALYVALEDGALSVMVKDYNTNVAKRLDLLTSATDNNPAVQALNKTLSAQRENIAVGAKEARTSAVTNKQHLTEQINKYSTALAQLPEQERTYLEMKRSKETKEEQYLYLIQKHEENSLLLASSSISAKVVEKAQMSAKVSSPDIKKTGAAAIFLGLLLPLLVYFCGIFKKEFF